VNSKNLAILQAHLARNPAPPPRASSFAFGMHKGGSTMLHTFFDIATRLSGIRSISASNILFRAGVTDEEYALDASIKDFFLDNKAVFIGFRYIPLFMLGAKGDFLNHKAIVLVRDPRDCVVSAYFSFLKSHVVHADIAAGSAQSILSERARHQSTTIDEYCLAEMHRFVGELHGYAYFAHENLRIYRYEDIIFDKRNFLAGALEYMGLDVREEAFETALQKVDVIPEAEMPDAHIRNVTPGDYKTKLKRETIEILNAEFRESLELFGYA